MKGMWWNHLKVGEGFIFAEEGDRQIGYFFTHIGRTTVWYLLNLHKTVQGYTGEVLKIEARIIAEPGNPGHSHDNPPIENLVGSCDLILQEDGESYIIDLNIGSNNIRYLIGSLFGTGLPQYDFSEPQPEPEPEPEPEPDPDPVNPFEGKLTFEIKGWKRPEFSPGTFVFRDGKWYAEWNTIQARHNRLHAGRNRMCSFRFTALENTTFTWGANGYGDPSVDGGVTHLAAGETMEIDMKLTKEHEPAGHENANYQVDTNWGTIVLLTARVMKS